MKTVFVTGGSGYIGRNLIRGLISAGFSVRALARSDASAAMVKSLGAV
ncbi:MAG: NmrA family NAD(P)-binding protein, partial [Aliifodinibius sp.]|nr:NmrA family NAD(P)-binding protein [Fodinibius sp.]NIY24334.1 NmrA family NAD(P)-binding protein [Fodinibius sp.]